MGQKILGIRKSSGAPAIFLYVGCFDPHRTTKVQVIPVAYKLFFLYVGCPNPFYVGCLDPFM